MATTNIELFDYADHRLCTTISSETPATDHHEATNLLAKPHQSRFMASTFIKPPIDLDLHLPHPITLAAITIDPRARQSHAKSVQISIQRNSPRDHHKWIPLGRLTWEPHERGPQGLYNRDLSPQTISAVAGRESLCGAAAWQPAMPDWLHGVCVVRVRISAMHQAHALGLGGIEIWAQPSQRLPTEQRTRAWAEIRQALQPPPTQQKDTETMDECPPQFIDTITLAVMRDPVILPSNIRCDRSTIIRHLSRSKTDPFTGLPLDLDEVKPDLR
ncbi:RING finger protein 37, partial [Coemansia sp. S610]